MAGNASRIAVMPGDDIGPDVMAATAAELDAIGDEHARFQPCHGSDPDISGKGIANPVAMILSAALMPDWLGSQDGTGTVTRAIIDQLRS